MNGPFTNGPSVREIAQMLRPHAESIALRVFPAARRDGAFLCVGSIHGEPGSSLKIRRTGPDAGNWADYAMAKGTPGAGGDLIDLLQHTICNGDKAAAVQEAKRFLSIDSMDPAKLHRHRQQAAKAIERNRQRDMEDKETSRRQAEGLWHSSSILTPSSPPVLYLQGRGIDLRQLGKMPGAIRFQPEMYHAQLERKVPAMVTKFQLGAMHAATHVTFLHRHGDGRWTKLPLSLAEPLGIRAKDFRLKQINGPAYTLRAHIPLWKGDTRGKLDDIPPGTPVECSEGIEDGLSYAMANPGARVIAGGTLGIIGVLQLPPQAGDFNVLAQNDTNPEPIASLEDAVRKQQAAAREDGSGRTVACRWPPQEYKDWNDWLRGVKR